MIEIQIHPSDIRRRVRYFFLDRRRVVAGIIALSFVLAGLIGSMAAAPTVIRRVYKTNFLKEQREGRGILIVIRNPAADELLRAENEPLPGEKHGSARTRMQRWRDIGVGAQILKNLGVRSIALLAPQEQRSFTLTATEVYKNNSYRITLQVRKQ